MQHVEDDLHKALQTHGETTLVGDLRAIVAQTLGLPLDGKHIWRIDKALFKLMRPPPKTPITVSLQYCRGRPSFRDVLEKETQG